MVLFALGTVWAGGQGEAAGAAADGAEFIVANGTEPESLDPHLISGVPEHRIYMGIFEGLVRPDPETSEALPGTAESWEISDDNTVYTFTIREGAQWSDGTPITAETVRDSWLRILNPETAAPYAWFPSMFIKGAAEYNAGEADASSVAVEAVDERTFRFETVGPLPYTLDALSHYSFGVVPLHVIEEHGEEWTLPENFVSNGPFVLEEWSPQERLTVVPNENYWDYPNRPNLSRVVYIPVDDQNTMYNMYINGEVDWSTEVPQGQIDQAKLRDDYHATPQLGTYYYVFQTQRGPLQDARVRRALSMAIDRVQLIDTVARGGQIPAFAMVPEMPNYPGIDGIEEAVSEAQQLLADAGYPNGEGFPEMTVLYNTSQNHQAIGEFIQQQWLDNLGINVSLTNQEWGTYLNTRRQGDFEIARAGWIGDYQDPNTFLDMFVTGAAMNGGKYSNSEYDRLISQAATMPAGEERMQVLADAERLLIEEDTAIMPIYYYTSTQMIDLTQWDGWYENLMDQHPVGHVAGS
jgi:oligopeptide transport system substrate-binding protein